MTENKATADVSGVPTFASYEEEAAFWDTHDLSDYWDEATPVVLHVRRKLIEAVTVQMSPDTVQDLRERAEAQGITVGALIHIWILQRLAAESEQPASEKSENGGVSTRRPDAGGSH